MNIAELFVRLRGDTSDFDTKMRGARRSLDGVTTSAGGSHASMGRLGQEMVTLTRRLLGLNPVVAQATNVLGGLAIGSTAMIGILGGVAAVGFAFEKLTESSRQAMDAADKLIVSYNQMAKVSSLGIGGQQKADLDTINKGLEEHAKWLNVIVGLREKLGGGASPLGAVASLFEGGHREAIASGTTAAAAARQQIVNAIGLQDAKDNQAWADRIKKEGEPAREAARKAAAEALQASETYWRGQHDLWKRATDQVAALNELARQFLLDNPVTAVANKLVMESIDTSVSMPNVNLNDSLTNEQKKQRESMGIFIEDSNKNAVKLSDAIWGSAIALGNQIVGALNLGGGGKGSSLGGAIGATAGFVAGSFIPIPGGQIVGQAVGSLVGNIAGSLFGGLFDHKKAVDNNTQAVRQLTQAMLLNAPQGFKIARLRYDATDIPALGSAARRYASRGGRNPLLVGT